MLNSFLGRCSVLFVVTMCIVVALQINDESTSNHYKTDTKKASSVHPSNTIELQRSKRLLFKKKQSKPGFFRTIGEILFQQINETTSAYRQISSLIRNSFADSNEVTSTAPPNPDPNAMTTMAPYRVTREDLFALLRRNLRGLVRLFKIEWNDALNQSRYSIHDYKKEFSNEIGRIVG